MDEKSKLNAAGEHYVVVYQFGKVASTSLVATLNRLPNIEAVQSHFLGCQTLQKMVGQMLSPDTSEYFFGHQIGQFVRNVEITRKMKFITSGRSNKHLVVISLSRDPVDWLKSSIVQDIQGYMPTFTNLAKLAGYNKSEPEEVIHFFLTWIFENVPRAIDRAGGIDNIFKKIKFGEFDASLLLNVPRDSGIPQFFHMMLRVFSWFEEHFEPSLGLELSSFDTFGDFWYKKRTDTDYIVLKYETMAAGFPLAMRHLGMPSPEKLSRENVSKGKLYENFVWEFFESNDLTDLTERFSQTRYCKYFGYYQ